MLFEFSQYVEQYFFPSGGMQVQLSIAHFFVSVAIVIPPKYLCSDAIDCREDVSLSAALQKVLGVFQARLGQLLPTEHSRYLPSALGLLHTADLCLCPSTFFRLLYEEMLIAECGNLRKMRNT